MGSPPLGIRITAPTVEITVPPDSTPGAVTIYTAATLNELRESPEIVAITNGPVDAPLRLEVDGHAQAFFRAIRRAGVSPGDVLPQASPELVLTPLVLAAYGLAEQPVVGFPYDLELLLFDLENQGQLADVTGQVTLALVHELTEAPHGDARWVPGSVSFVAGRARARVTLEASTSVAGYRLAVIPSQESNSRSSLHRRLHGPLEISLMVTLADPEPLPEDPGGSGRLGFLTLVRERLRAISNAEDPSWASPLGTATPVVTGGFGEWRGYRRNGSDPNNIDRNYHAGLDLRAAAGQDVRASRAGVVTHLGEVPNGLQYYVNLIHFDGSYSRYLHIGSKVRPKRGAVVGRSDTIGLVGSLPAGYTAHLHFEVHSGKLNSGVDPLSVAQMFKVSEPTARPVLHRIALSPLDPRTEIVPLPMTNLPSSFGTIPGATYLVAQIRQTEDNKLPPSSLAFSTTDIQMAITPRTEEQVVSLLPANARDMGFARYPHSLSVGAANATTTDYYRYWFKWATLGFLEDPSGPRAFDLVASNALDRAQAPVRWRLKWGPEILEIEDLRELDAATGARKHRVRIRGWRGEPAVTSAEDLTVFPWTGRDWYQYALPDGGRWVKGSDWELSEEDRVLVETSQVGSTGTHAVRERDFFWSPPSSDSKLSVEVSSRMSPHIAHRRQATAFAPTRAIITIRTFANAGVEGSPWRNVAGPITVTIGNPIGAGVAFNGSNGGPPWGNFSETVPVPREYFPCNLVIGLPPRPGGPPVNRSGKTSFIARSGIDFWVCASGGSFSLSGGITTELEYQLRYRPYDPSLWPIRTGETLEIGSVTRSGIWTQTARIPVEDYTLVVD